MKSKIGRLSILAVLPLYLASCASKIVSIDVGRIMAETSQRPIGINVNYLVDDDATRTPTRSLTEALRDMGVRYLRFPSGEDSDAYLWSVPPYNTPFPTLARTGPEEWPANDQRFTLPDQHTLRDTLDFDEFMSMAQAIGAEPVLVICYDSMYKPARKGGSAPTRQQLLDTAAAWVQYANVTKGYHVRYWELGNESYLDSYNGQATAQQYAQDLVSFSTVMKAVDPTIKIGANGNDELWWNAVLSVAAEDIDFLAVHIYPPWAWGSYDYYRTESHNFLSAVHTALEAIETAAPPSERARLRVAVTEFNAIDYAKPGAWPNVNDLGHALVVFDLMGQILSQPQVEFSQLWVTRWVRKAETSAPEVYDALDQFNQLNAVGRAVAVWGQVLGAQMVEARAAEPIRAYATYTPATRRLAVLLLNKDTVERSTVLTMNSYHAGPVAQSWVLTGSGPTDTQPTWTRQPDISVDGPRLATSLLPLSVTAVLFEGTEDIMAPLTKADPKGSSPSRQYHE